jgi:hydroxymethylpyrimidine/phosphomethylpyrimidine kinase
MQPVQNPVVLSIAGFDPSGGAGILADIKTFEQAGVYGCGIATCITYQNDTKFEGIKWLSFDEIKAQFKPLAERFQIGFVKIGLIEDAKMLKSIVQMLTDYNPDVKIIWDPVLKTSSGYLVHGADMTAEIGEITRNIYLITPNTTEAAILKISDYKQNCNILVKGGHGTGDESIDILYHDGKEIEFSAKRIPGIEKHGSGCVFSAAVTAFLNRDTDLETSVGYAKEYTIEFLKSAESLLGVHNKIAVYTGEIPY